MTETYDEIRRSIVALDGLFCDRNVVYKDNFYRHGEIMNVLFPEGINRPGPDDHNRFAILSQIVNKLARYAVNFDGGGHADSLDDLAVYAMILKQLDKEREQENGV